MSYTLDGITLQAKRTPSEIGYWEYGASNLPTLVYLHGVGEKGDGSESALMSLLNQGSLARNWVNGGYNGWAYKDVFGKGIRILYPQLPPNKSSCDVAYIDSFLDAVLTPDQPLYLCGWSLGGGGALRYAAQLTKKHKLTLVVGIASAISPTTGENVDCPYLIAHSTNDGTVNVSNSDNYVAKIKNSDPTKYKRGNSGDHWYYLSEAFYRPDLYDWFIQLAGTQPPVNVDIPGTIVKNGNDVFGIFGSERIKLNQV